MLCFLRSLAVHPKHLPKKLSNMRWRSSQREGRIRRFTKVFQKTSMEHGGSFIIVSYLPNDWLRPSGIILMDPHPLKETIMQIPKSQAALLPNRTYPIKQKPGYYIAMLDVFHQLHCLVRMTVDFSVSYSFFYRNLRQNMIRQALHRDYYAWDEEHLREEHISHCVDSIRQSLMQVTCWLTTQVNQTDLL